MQSFTVLTAVAVPFEFSNVDTDQILPARFLRRPRSEGFANVLFRDLRFDEKGNEIPAFALNQTPYRKAGIMVADRNFGGGSSREQAVWALVDFGIRCVIASSFGDIFYNNSLKNGFLPVRLPEEAVKVLRESARRAAGKPMTVDLEQQAVIAPDGARHNFEIDSFRKRCLLKGLDDIGVTLEYETEITAFERGYRERRHWL
ncbi:MAG: 3-isopropylmalate dehydratase small subunit [Alphaproteobacteria bacterium]|nr:3-isopropylmalate dehydratase small subunit [Alphaproteobacteria bacterium]